MSTHPVVVLSAYEFAAAEMLAIHEHLDKLCTPTHVNGERLSASQRVEVLVGAYKSACGRIGQDA